MMCPKCGKLNQDNSAFCINCGNPLSVVTNNEENISAININSVQNVNTGIDIQETNTVVNETSVSIEPPRENIVNPTVESNINTNVQTSTAPVNNSNKVSVDKTTVVDGIKNFFKLLIKPVKTITEDVEKSNNIVVPIFGLLICLIIGIIDAIVKYNSQTINIFNFLKGKKSFGSYIGSSLLEFLGLVILVVAFGFIFKLINNYKNKEKKTNIVAVCSIFVSTIVFARIFGIIAGLLTAISVLAEGFGAVIFIPIIFAPYLYPIINFCVVLMNFLSDDGKITQSVVYKLCLAILGIIVISEFLGLLSMTPLSISVRSLLL